MTETLNAAVSAYNSGRFAEAELLCRQILSAKPDLFDAAHLLAVAASRLGKQDIALSTYERALALRPGDVNVRFNRANTLQKLGQFEAAVADYERVLVARPDYVEALFNRGNALAALGRYDEALASFDRALALRPNDPHILYNRGAVLHELKRFEAALESYDRALAVVPEFVEALSSRGVTLHALGRFDAAMASYDAALARRPNCVESLHYRGFTLYELRRFEEALTNLDRALAAQPAHAEVLCKRGNVLVQLDRLDEALASYRGALALRADYAEAYNGCGRVLLERGRPREALASFDRAVALKPDDADFHCNRALCLLQQGDFDRGWTEYEQRWNASQMANAARPLAQPLWLGEQDLKRRTILLHAEQGSGDTIQFCRYATLVAGLGARVVLEVPIELQALLRSLEGPVQVIAQGDPLPEFDCHCPLMSLPLAFKTRLGSIPAESSYLRPPAEKLTLWRERIGTTTKPRIGLAWAGNPRPADRNASRIDRQRSIDLDQLSPILASTHFEFYSLQKGEAAPAQLRYSPWRRCIVDWTDDLLDFADTAALIANLDIVISVDTAVAHLAGALGKPFWLLNRFNTCWRWLRDREDSPWYPTARLFRQHEPGGWDDVITRVRLALDDLVRPA